MDGMDRREGVRWPGAPIGAHNALVYGELLGFSAEEVSAFGESGLI